MEKIKKLKDIAKWLEFIGLLMFIYLGSQISLPNTAVYIKGLLAGIGLMMAMFAKKIIRKDSCNNNS